MHFYIIYTYIHTLTSSNNGSQTSQHLSISHSPIHFVFQNTFTFSGNFKFSICVKSVNFKSLDLHRIHFEVAFIISAKKNNYCTEIEFLNGGLFPILWTLGKLICSALFIWKLIKVRKINFPKRTDELNCFRFFYVEV